MTVPEELFFMDDMLERLLAFTKDCRVSMHEPDEQGIYAELHQGRGFDNAFLQAPGQGPPGRSGRPTLGSG